MTREEREEAIELLEKEKAYMLGHGGDAQANALNMAIQALEQQNELFKMGLLKDCESCKAQLINFIGKEEVEEFRRYLDSKEQCDDAISRQAYIERYRKWGYSEFGRKVDNEALAIRVAMSLPPVTTEQEPKTGQWVKIKPYPLQMHDYECSECGHETDDNTENYCSNCGAKMESGDEK